MKILRTSIAVKLAHTRVPCSPQGVIGRMVIAPDSEIVAAGARELA